MEVYQRITERVRGSLWAHHRKLMSERQFKRILSYVYNNKYEFQIRLDKLTVVGSEWGGKVEVATTPSGHIKRVRVNPQFQDLPVAQQQALLLSAYSSASKKGRDIMQQCEMKVYSQFLQDLKPIVLGIRDNPEFYTVPEDAIETHGGVLRGRSAANNASQQQAVASSASSLGGTASSSLSNSSAEPVRTIPFAKAFEPKNVFANVQNSIARRSASPEWNRTAVNKKLAKTLVPENRPRGAPGPKKSVEPFQLNVPYMSMDEARLQKKNWMAYLDNKHVAETLWTRAKVGDRQKQLNTMRRYGQAWHTNINEDVANRSQ